MDCTRWREFLTWEWNDKQRRGEYMQTQRREPRCGVGGTLSSRFARGGLQQKRKWRGHQDLIIEGLLCSFLEFGFQSLGPWEVVYAGKSHEYICWFDEVLSALILSRWQRWRKNHMFHVGERTSKLQFLQHVIKNIKRCMLEGTLAYKES